MAKCCLFFTLEASNPHKFIAQFNRKFLLDQLFHLHIYYKLVTLSAKLLWPRLPKRLLAALQFTLIFIHSALHLHKAVFILRVLWTSLKLHLKKITWQIEVFGNVTFMIDYHWRTEIQWHVLELKQCKIYIPLLKN